MVTSEQHIKINHSNSFDSNIKALSYDLDQIQITFTKAATKVFNRAKRLGYPFLKSNILMTDECVASYFFNIIMC